MGLGIADFVLDLEEEFGISIPDASQNIVTVAECIDYVFSLVQRLPQEAQKSQDEVQRRVVELLSVHTSVPVEEITLDKAIVDDLGLD